jgi:hypothetical protein
MKKMKNFVLGIVLFISAFCDASVSMTRVDPSLFIHQPLVDLNAITTTNEALKLKMVEYLFENDLLDHVGTKAYQVNASFLSYYKQFGSLYRLIDLNNDHLPELIFNGFISPENDKEYLEIYGTDKGNVIRLFREVGHILAYKIQPNTKEVLLFHHQYPCCENASHNLNRLRLVGSKIVSLNRYFLGRDTGMLGSFFPKKSKFTGRFKKLAKTTTLYWSNQRINRGAWVGRTEVNRIADYDTNVVYTVLATQKKWQFVLMKGAPKLDKGNRVINPANFTSMWIYGWIEQEE